MKSEPLLARDATHCRNCGAAVSAKFCSACGQETTLHVPSALEFLHEFIGHYIALEGKLWKTLALLLFRPGRLTADYIAGKRARYVLPLRLYLTLSILFFALLKFGSVHINFDKDKAATTASAEATQARAEVKDALKAELAAADKAQPDADKATRTPADADTAQKAQAEVARQLRPQTGQTNLDTLYPKWGARVHAFIEKPASAKGAALEAGFYSYGPYAMFALMPLFALYLKVLYLGSGRRYGEHLLFAFHTNAFAFVMFGALMHAPLTTLKLALLAWLAIYLPMAMRRVYGGGRWATALRWMVLMFVHLLSLATAIVGALFLGVVS